MTVKTSLNGGPAGLRWRKFMTHECDRPFWAVCPRCDKQTPAATVDTSVKSQKGLLGSGVDRAVALHSAVLSYWNALSASVDHGIRFPISSVSGLATSA